MPPSGEAPFSPADERNTSPLDERGFSSLGERGISPDSECSLSKNSITILSISYMRRNLSTLFLGAALLLAATSSCTNELPDGTACGDAAISFHTPAVTRAAVEGDFPEGSQFSVWGWYTSQNGSNQPFDNVPVTNSNGTWSYTGGDRYWVLGAEYDFYAVYPATGITASCTQDGTLTVTDFDASKTGDEAVDLMTARKTGIQANESTVASAVELGFGHELAKVSVVLRTDPGVRATLNSASLYGMALKGSFSRDLKNGGNAVWENFSEEAVQDNTPFTVSDISLSENASQDIFANLLLIPQNVSGLQLTIDLTRNGNEQVTETIDLGTSITRWTAGQTYRYVLTVKVDAITFSDFTVPEWEESGTGGNVNIGSDSNN